MDNYFDTLQKIYNLRGGIIDLRLDRMDRALALFDHPERRFPSLHIAGTNGKGSTSAMLQHVLQLAGYRTGLYTSPHLVSFTERIRVGDEEISENRVVELAEEINLHLGMAGVPLTFFEFVTVMAFIHFARQKVDLAVVEVGLGGRLDATNVVTPMVSVVTTIAKDHEAYLGADVLSIARENGGIIKPTVPSVCGKLPPEVGPLLKAIADERGSPCYFLGTDFRFTLKNEGLFDYTGIKHHSFNALTVALRGRHQRANAAVALAALELVAPRLPMCERAVREGLATVRWPGRLEVMLEQPTVVLDGAHNAEGVQALIDELADLPPDRKVKLLFAAMVDKEWQLMVTALANVVSEFVFTRVEMERSADPERLAETVSDSTPRRVMHDARAAVRALVDQSDPEDVIVVAGSLYLVGEVRPTLEQIAAERTAIHKTGTVTPS